MNESKVSNESEMVLNGTKKREEHSICVNRVSNPITHRMFHIRMVFLRYEFVDDCVMLTIL